ncbi:FAD-dependent oxidoreductase [Cellulomonas sp. URHE0023]|uniref:FAD-dependent oxidoreductase n=1 Tax=Cellulomonas sp. URHE0023 TaxID=1380354 RepID=UPI000550739C|nr:FAD-dependent oxidoreductase [Cellulomonas sp. URHE0023]
MSDDILRATGGREVETVRFPIGRPPSEVDVLVVGAGPVGLSAAVELTALGVEVAVVDAATSASLARAGAIGHTPRVVELFRRWGLLQQIRDEWTFPPEWNRGTRFVTSLAGHVLVAPPRRGFAQSSVTPFSLADSIRRPQSALQKVFLERLEAHSVSVTGGWRVEDVQDTGDGVVTTVVGNGERREVRSRYVIGADGGSSTVRRLAGVGRSGDYATEKNYRLVVRTKPAAVGAAPSGVNIVFNQQASGFLAAISSTDWRVYSEPYPLDAEPTQDELLATARAAFGITDLDLELLSVTSFFRATRIADTFRSGRILLAGDAAHVRTPGGNLGEGFGDVVNLGWKLAAVLRGHGGEALLDSYDRERRPHNRRVAQHALARSQAGASTLEEIRRLGVPDDADTSEQADATRALIGGLIAAQYSPSPGVTFDERYDDSPVVAYEPGQAQEDHPWAAERYTLDPRPGHRAPDGYIDPFGDTLYDRIGHDLTLLVLGGSGAEAFEASALERGVPLSVVHLDDEHVRELYGADLVLVRPDHHVAWRGDLLPEDADAVLDVVLGQRALVHL